MATVQCPRAPLGVSPAFGASKNSAKVIKISRTHDRAAQVELESELAPFTLLKSRVVGDTKV